jgi:hypothetical protein
MTAKGCWSTEKSFNRVRKADDIIMAGAEPYCASAGRKVRTGKRGGPILVRVQGVERCRPGGLTGAAACCVEGWIVEEFPLDNFIPGVAHCLLKLMTLTSRAGSAKCGIPRKYPYPARLLTFR